MTTSAGGLPHCPLGPAVYGSVRAYVQSLYILPATNLSVKQDPRLHNCSKLSSARLARPASPSETDHVVRKASFSAWRAGFVVRDVGFSAWRAVRMVRKMGFRPLRTVRMVRKAAFSAWRTGSLARKAAFRAWRAGFVVRKAKSRPLRTRSPVRKASFRSFRTEAPVRKAALRASRALRAPAHAKRGRGPEGPLPLAKCPVPVSNDPLSHGLPPQYPRRWGA